MVQQYFNLTGPTAELAMRSMTEPRPRGAAEKTAVAVRASGLRLLSFNRI